MCARRRDLDPLLDLRQGHVRRGESRLETLEEELGFVEVLFHDARQDFTVRLHESVLLHRALGQRHRRRGSGCATLARSLRGGQSERRGRDDAVRDAPGRARRARREEENAGKNETCTGARRPFGCLRSFSTPSPRAYTPGMATRSFPLPPASARAELAHPCVVRIVEVQEGTVSVEVEEGAAPTVARVASTLSAKQLADAHAAGHSAVVVFERGIRACQSWSGSSRRHRPRSKASSSRRKPTRATRTSRGRFSRRTWTASASS